MNIDLSLPVYCGGERKYGLVKSNTADGRTYICDLENDLAWYEYGSPLGKHPPLTNVPPVPAFMCEEEMITGKRCYTHCGGECPIDTPPVKPEVDKTGEEVKVEIEFSSTAEAYHKGTMTRIDALEEMVRELRNLSRTGEDEEGTIWVALNSLISRATHHDTLTRSKNLVP